DTDDGNDDQQLDQREGRPTSGRTFRISTHQSSLALGSTGRWCGVLALQIFKVPDPIRACQRRPPSFVRSSLSPQHSGTPGLKNWAAAWPTWVVVASPPRSGVLGAGRSKTS